MTQRAFLYSLVLHTLVLTALIISSNAVRQPLLPSWPKTNIVEAYTVDVEAVERELDRIRAVEQSREQALDKKRKDLAQQVVALRKDSKDSTQIEEPLPGETVRIENEGLQVGEEGDRITAQTPGVAIEEPVPGGTVPIEKGGLQVGEEGDRITARTPGVAIAEPVPEETVPIENGGLQVGEKGDRITAQMLGVAKDKKRTDAELTATNAEEDLLAETLLQQQKQDRIILQDIRAKLYRVVTGNFNRTGLPEGLESIISVHAIPGGEVVRVTVYQSSGNEVFDRRAVTAVGKASPLPLPADPATFDRLRLREFTFKFKLGNE